MLFNERKKNTKSNDNFSSEILFDRVMNPLNRVAVINISWVSVCFIGDVYKAGFFANSDFDLISLY